MNITFNDISKRIRNRGVKSTGSALTPRLYTGHNVFCTNNAVDAIMNWESLAENSNEAFNKALDVFEEVCLNENASTIRKCGTYLAENVDKVRDASQLERSLKNRTGRLKGKIKNKINKQYDPVNNAIKNSIAAINKTLSSKGVSVTTSTVDKAVDESFIFLLDECKKIKECDRIIENYSKISKRFNIDRIINEVNYSNDIYPAIVEITKCIDTYSIPFKNKYSHALETSFYALNKYNMNYPSEKIIEAVTDYFIFSSVLTEEDISSIKEVRDISVVFEQEDFNKSIGDIINSDDPIDDYMYDDEEDEIFGFSSYAENLASDLIESYCSPFHEDEISLKEKKKQAKKEFRAKKKEARKAARDLKKAAKQGNPDERLDRKTKKEIDNFRKECAKDPDNKNNITRLKALISGIFTKSPYQIVYDLPNFFVIIRTLLVIGGTAINPILGLLTFITSKIIGLTLSRKQTEKIVKAYQNEIDSIKAKLEKTKDNDTKESLQKYLDELNKDYAKIKEYENNLYSEDENDDRDTSTEYNNEEDDDWDDFDFDDWDDFDFEEAASIVYISDMVESISEGLIDDNVEGIIFKNLYKLDNDSIDTLTNFSITVPDVLEKDKLCEALIEYRNSLRETSNKVTDYIRIDCLNENIHKLKEDTNVYATSKNLSGIRCYLACLNEMVNMNASEDYIMEMNFSNTLKLAVDRLKKTATKLKDKDRQISNSIDVAVNNVSKGMETALMNDNREAVIKGKILPSASKCIKIACTLGVTWAINPAVAVITAVGGLAANKKLKAKERQLILDDIEIELKMVDRYIKQAEDEGDLKKVRELEIIQRNLQRQQQRIKYKMHVVYKQNVPNVSDND